MLGLCCSTQAFSRCGAQALEHTCLVAKAHKLSCPAACGILVPQLGIKLKSPVLEGRFLTMDHKGSCLIYLFCVSVVVVILSDTKIVPFQATATSQTEFLTWPR